MKKNRRRWNGKSKEQISKEMSRIRRVGWAKKSTAEKSKVAAKLLKARWNK